MKILSVLHAKSRSEKPVLPLEFTPFLLGASLLGTAGGTGVTTFTWIAVRTHDVFSLIGVQLHKKGQRRVVLVYWGPVQHRDLPVGQIWYASIRFSGAAQYTVKAIIWEGRGLCLRRKK